MSAEVARKLIRPTEEQRFPFVSLPKALDRVRQLYKIANIYEVAIPTTAKAWDYAEKSSGVAQTISALKVFGLLDDRGNGAARKVKLSETATKIIRDPREISAERDALIKQAALKPPIHRSVIEHFQGSMPPSDEAFKAYLLMDLGFRDGAAHDFMREFSETMAFAKIGGSDIVPVENEANSRDNRKPPAIGDLVQWEPGGVEQFPAPRRVTGLSPDGGFVFVDGSGTGLPVREVNIIMEAAPPLKTVTASSGSMPVEFTSSVSTTRPSAPAPVSPSAPRRLAGWNFEQGGSVEIYVTGNIATDEALDMVDTLTKMKRAEMNRRKGEPQPVKAGGLPDEGSAR